MPRKIADCRDFPSETKCTLAISGEEDEVLRAATEHAVSVHGHHDSPELRDEIRKTLKDESFTNSGMNSGKENREQPRKAIA